MIGILFFTIIVLAATLGIVYAILYFLQGSKYEIKEPAANTLYREIARNAKFDHKENTKKSSYEKEKLANTIHKEIVKNSEKDELKKSNLYLEQENTNKKTYEKPEPANTLYREIAKNSEEDKADKSNIYLAIEQKKSNDFNSWNIDLLQRCEWKVFEEICKNLLEEMGYDAETTRVGADGGIDIIFSNDNLKGIAQCKTGRKKVIGEKPIRELYGVLKLENSDVGIFFTTGKYNKKAYYLGEKTGINLIDGNEIIEKINALPKDTQKNIYQKTIDQKFETPTCTNCNIKMIVKENKITQNEFWACPNYPKCKLTMKKY